MTTQPSQSRRAARVEQLARQDRQRRIVRGSLLVAFVLILALVGVLAFRGGGATAKTADASGRAYLATPDDFRLPGLLEPDKTVSLADFKGTPVVVNFFASWCLYCNKELPGFVEVAKATAGTVAFVGVNTSETGDGAEMARRYDLAGAGFALASDIGGDPASDLWLSYGSQGLPVTAFYDANGALVDFAGGMLTEDELTQRIEKLFGVSRS